MSSDANPSPSQTALDKKLEFHEDRCATQRPHGEDMACTCGRDEALAELKAMREQFQAVKRGVIQSYRALGMDLEILATLYAPQVEQDK